MEIRNSSIPTRTRVMGSSRCGVTQRKSFFAWCLTGATGKKDHTGHADVCRVVGVQLLILHIPRYLVARRGGLQWGEAQYGSEALLWLQPQEGRALRGGSDMVLHLLIRNSSMEPALRRPGHAPEKELCGVSGPFLASGRSVLGGCSTESQL